MLAYMRDILRRLTEQSEPPALYTGPRRLRRPGMFGASAVALARTCVGEGTYILGAGGRNPDAVKPWTKKGTRLGSDCVGFVLWAWGMDRFQPSFPLYGGWINTDSAIGEARTSAKWFRIVDVPQPGDLVTVPSVDLDRDGDRDRIGHVGIISEVPALWDGDYADLRVIHCSASGRPAVKETSGKIWDGRQTFKGRTNPKWASVILRVLP